MGPAAAGGEAPEGARRATLRARRRAAASPSAGAEGAEARLAAAWAAARRIVVFSGSGMSASAGMSTFSTRGGLYDRARRRFGLRGDGVELFTFGFFERRPADCRALLADVFLEALRAKPTASHRALGEAERAGRLRRHYTLNIDGLHAAEGLGLGTWCPHDAPDAVTAQLHGSVRQAVCPACTLARPMDRKVAREWREGVPVPCMACGGETRPRVMLYGDGHSEAVTPNEILDLLEDDMADADLVLWGGLSFKQSASVEYFRQALRHLRSAGRENDVPLVVLNPDAEALWNLRTACTNTDSLPLFQVEAASDDVLPALVGRPGLDAENEAEPSHKTGAKDRGADGGGAEGRKRPKR